MNNNTDYKKDTKKKHYKKPSNKNIGSEDKNGNKDINKNKSINKDISKNKRSNDTLTNTLRDNIPKSNYGTKHKNSTNKNRSKINHDKDKKFNYQKKKFDKNKNFEKKYRKSIVQAMDFEKTAKYGFDTAYFIFERSINRLEKEGDEAEAMALEFLKERNLLGENFSSNRIIALNTIKIEADIIDYDNKIIYETKSRKTGKLAKQAVIKKWKTFEYDKVGSNYENFEFKGIIVANYEDGKKVKAVIDLDGKTFDKEKIKLEFEEFYNRLEELKKIKKPIKKSKEKNEKN